MKRYYWLKLDRHFMKRHDIRILKSMPNGKDYVLFYMTLLLESIDHEGALRFNEFIPYDETMLSTITDTNIDVVRTAIVVLKNMKLLEVLDDGTIYMNETQKMLGENSTERVRKYRENKKLALNETPNETQCNVTCNGNETQNVTEIDKEIDIDKDKDIKTIDRFETFWKVYPKKIGKDKCRRWFETHKIDDTMLDNMIQAIKVQSNTTQWTKDNGQFIPHPYTWLNQGRWQDEVEQNRWDKIDMEGF